MEMGKTFVSRFAAICDGNRVSVDFRLAKKDQRGNIRVAVRRPGDAEPRFVSIGTLTEVPVGRLAIIRQLHGRRQFVGP